MTDKNSVAKIKLGKIGLHSRGGGWERGGAISLFLFLAFFPSVELYVISRLLGTPDRNAPAAWLGLNQTQTSTATGRDDSGQRRTTAWVV